MCAYVTCRAQAQADVRRPYNRTNTVDASDFKDLPNVGHNIFVEQAVRNGDVVEEKFAMYDFTSFTDPHIWKNLTIPLIASNQFFKFSKDEVGDAASCAATRSPWRSPLW